VDKGMQLQKDANYICRSQLLTIFMTNTHIQQIFHQAVLTQVINDDDTANSEWLLQHWEILSVTKLHCQWCQKLSTTATVCI